MNNIIISLLLFISIQALSQETNCGDGIDNDNDGLIDCFDIDCNGQSKCPNGFPCSPSSTFYQVQNTSFVQFDPNNNNTPFVPITQTITLDGTAINLNAIGYNIEDGYIYGMRTDLGHRDELIRIDSDGNATLIKKIQGVNTQDGFVIGDFDLNGNLYIGRIYHPTVHVIDVNSPNLNVVDITLDNSIGCADFCFNPVNQRFYGLTTQGALREFTLPVGGGLGTVNDMTTNGYSTTCNFYGAAFADANGSLYFFCNDNGQSQAELIKIDNATIGNPTSTPIRNIDDALSKNDGAGCALSTGLLQEGEYCCDGNNLIENGSFENGDNGFNSDYNSKPAGDPVNPNDYSVIDFNNATSICSNWNVEDHTHCITGNNNQILVVNGQTQQSTNSNNVIWQTQAPIRIERDSQYRFCAYVNHLEQCCFDIAPMIRVEIRQGGGSWTSILNWTSITNTASPCVWQEIGAAYTANSTSVEIRILIREVGNGDGNDLAIDDISFTKLSRPNLTIEVSEQVPSNPLILEASINNLTNVDDALPSSGCEYIWAIVRVTDLSPLQLDWQQTILNGWFGGSSIGNNWGLTTNFPGISIPGNDLYQVHLFVYDCDCSADAGVFQYSGGGLSFRKKFGQNDVNSLKKNKINTSTNATIAKYLKLFKERGKLTPIKPKK